MGVKRGFRHRCSRKKTKFTGKKRNPYMISLFLWRSFKNLKRWFSYRNDKNSEVFLRWFSFSEMSFFQKIQAMIFTFRCPQFLCLKISLFNDKENDIRSVMIRGKSPLLPKWGSRTVIVECSPCHSERKVLLSYRKRDSGIIWKWTDKSVINQK